MKKYRDEFKQFIVEGDKLIAEIPNNLLEFTITADELNKRNFNKLSSLTTPQSAIAVCKKPLSSAINSNFVPVLDRIQDPTNVGAILRTAAAANLRDVILLEGTADAFSSKSIRASMGAIFHLNLVEMSEKDLLNKNFNLVAAHINGFDYRQFKLPSKCAIIFGNEGGGVSKNLLDVATKINIPIHNVESLNVNAAAAILLFHYAI